MSPPPPLRVFRPDLPARVEEVIFWALAYVVSTTARLELVDLTGQAPPRSIFLSAGFYHVVWSPDGTKVLTWAGADDFSYLTVSTGVVTPIPLASGQDVAGYDGWIDDTHIAVNSYQGAGVFHDPNGNTEPTSVTLDTDLTEILRVWGN
jgi:hypothetical protein